MRSFVHHLADSVSGDPPRLIFRLLGYSFSDEHLVPVEPSVLTNIQTRCICCLVRLLYSALAKRIKYSEFSNIWESDRRRKRSILMTHFDVTVQPLLNKLDSYHLCSQVAKWALAPSTATEAFSNVKYSSLTRNWAINASLKKAIEQNSSEMEFAIACFERFEYKQ